jgi:hypothetical protein
VADAVSAAQQGLRVLDEAVRLLDVLQAEWRPRGEAPESDGADEGAHHGRDCRACPLCRALAALREANPEAVARMTGAVADLAGAIGDLVAGPARAQETAPGAATGNRWDAADGPRSAPPGTGQTMVQRIDVTE